MEESRKREWIWEVMISGAEEQLALVLGKMKASTIMVPLLDISMAICLIMSLMLFVERVYMAVVITIVKLSGRKPDTRYKCEPIEQDLEQGSLAYPMVLVQIPMFNEREVYQLSIGAACRLSWPSDRFIVQVLDVSTDLTIKSMVEAECERWASQGINIKYEIRDNRNGYKAGALKEGLKRSYVKECDHVAIFDADFQPEPDFLHRTIPFLIHNPQIGLVQARWKFGSNFFQVQQQISFFFFLFLFSLALHVRICQNAQLWLVGELCIHHTCLSLARARALVIL